MLTLKELRLSGIGPFVEEQIVKFDSLGNLIQVDGIRNDTGGSSGSGKTTLFNSLDYLFGINEVPNTVLQSYITKDPISVSAVLDYDGQVLKLDRTKGKLTVDLAGEVTVGSNKLAEEKLDQIIGMPRSLFRPMLHKRQKEGGFFLNFTPKETHEFLTDLLGLSAYREKAEKVEQAAKSLGVEIQTAKVHLSSALAALEATADALKGIGSEPKQEILQDTILALKQAAEASQAALRARQLEHETELKILDGQRPILQRPELKSEAFNDQTLKANQARKNAVLEALKALENSERERIDGVNRQIYKQKVELAQLQNAIIGAEKAKTEALKLAQEIKKIRSGICSTCEQPWVHDSAKAKEAQLLQRVSELKNEMVAGDSAKAAMAAAETQINALSKSLEPSPNPAADVLMIELKMLNETIEAESNRQSSHRQEQDKLNRAIMDAHMEKSRAAEAHFLALQADLRKKHSTEIESLRSDFDAKQRAFESSQSSLRAYVEAKKRYDEHFHKLKSQHEAYLSQAKAHQEKVEALSAKLTVVEEISRALKSFISISFDDALEAVSEAATRTIRGIPNMANATIQLEGTKETKDGKIKEEVTAVIHKDGFEAIPIKSLSGGERSSVDLAVDLAVIDLLETRTNKGINVFILDEPFNGLDTGSIEQALYILQNNNPNRQIVIVDHNPMISEFIQSKILVTKNGSSSTISS